ncbi:polypeptide [Hepacivirus platyrrhini]|uniref:Genome polyprotein n=13 Tax=Hepacivirus TaxID=11102 RepID=POLG_GBVB|nr:polypeptide [Hepacivirus platyrrhini]Q69422.1 RecName: Full=Genome polyprotein; Contains: RecName: Full=Core protein; Contains: RecName: Full=Envelope glycoprotein E1; Contains: RecName: Full=Envelope glycoprotein E2; AltName: Full=NS1; Contains: RecName: Full=p13; Contains: RecName: Full=p6; Contains: RecName: Full=Viroporin p7; Contains: RecName: Full=Protease NS2; AltName: Full=Non-structural protein 2; Short=NS2; Contains: RecName: Full=Serine protease/helicase NS3; AltName: Full=Hepaciviri
MPVISTQTSPVPAPRTRKNKQTQASYPVSIKTSVERGQRAKRKVQRDARPRNYKIAGIHDGLQTLAQAALPAHGWGRQDPRHKSRNLGILLDYPLGWIGDVTTHTPLVGPLVAGAVVRPVCQIVRLLEDGVNWATGWFGVHLFVVCLLSLACPCSGARVTDPDTNTTILTNCCQRNQVIYCSPSTCLHEPGCVICADECWVPANPYISHPSNWTGTDSFLADHIDFVMGALVTCDALDIGELCGACVLVGDWLVRHWLIHIDLNETGTCYLEVPTGIDPGFLGFIGWMAGKVEAVIFLTKLASQVPYAIATMFSSVHYLAVGALIYYASRGKWYQLLLALMLYIEATSGNPIRVPTGCSIAEFCSPLMIPCPCHSYLSENVSEVICYSPKWTRPVTLEYNNSISWYPYTIPGARGCMVKFKNNTWGCCRIRNVPSYCTMGTDAVWNDTRNTYEACGVTPWLTTAWHNGSALKLAILQYPGSKEMFKPHNWMSGHLYFEGSDTPIVYFYDPVNSTLLPPERWARLPGTPPVVRGSWLQVPQGFYSDVKDLATGLITKDKAWKNYQVLYSATGALSLTGVTTKAVVLILLGLCGSKYLILAYLCYLSLCFGRASGYPLRPVLPSQSYLQAGWDVLSKAQVAPFALIFFICCYLRCRLRYAALLGFVPMAAGLPLTFFVAAAAAQPDYDWWVRLLVAGLVLWAGRDRGPRIALLVGPWPLVALLTLLHLATPASAFDTEIIGGLTIPPVVALVVMSRFGFFAHLLPRCALVNSYLWQRWENWFWNVTLRPERFLLVLVCFPGATYDTLVTFCVCHVALLCLTSSAASFFGTDSRVRAHRMLVRLGKCHAWYSHYVLKFFLLVFGENGVFFYKHLHGDVLPNDFASKLPLQEPFFPFEGKARVYRNEGRRLACGDTVDGLPVVARLGDLVFAGLAMPPDGWAITAPFTLQCLSERGTLSAMAVVMTGIDPRTWTGTIFRLGSLATSYMGFVCDNVLYTAHHGSKGRRLAHPTGSIHPITVDAANDQDIYQPPCGAGSLTRCSCGETKGYLVTRLGSLVEVNKSDDPYWCVCGALPMAVAKGSSGAPILCSSGHVIGMFTAARNSGGSVSQIRVRPLVCAGYHPQYTAHATLDTKPTVPNEYSVQILIAPTGSGKSTKLPLSYMQEKYEVLVLNPSVATTASMPKYMHATYGVNPNCYFNGKCTNTGASLTYSTYGMYLTGACSRNYDVIICDECHATDATTVLGIGKVLTEAPSKNVRLVVLATATPPGVIPTPHANITEIQLTDEGTIPFHGKKIKEENLKKGRHLIFEATKKHCDELANELARKGITAVSYYRGCDISKIPEGDCVVVATDALCTGYTGDFDSVYDCSLMVEGTCHVDLDPTFTMGVRVCGVSAIVKGQRRGRTGRGRAGIYYYVDGSCTPSGMVPECNIVEAFDAAKAWYGLSSTEAQTILDTYRTQPGLPAIGANLDEWADLFSMVNPEPSFVNTAKRTADNYVLLTAAQLQLCHQYGYAAPNDAPRWQGARLGKKPCGVLWRLDGADACPGPEPSEVTRYQMCFTEVNTSGTAALAVGVGVAMAYLAIDTFGATCVRRCWSITSVPTGATVAPVVDEEEIVEECASFIPLEAMVAAIDKLKSTITTTSPFTLETALEKLNTFLGPHAATILAIIEYCCGLVTLPDNPFASCVFAFIAGITTPLPHKIKMFLSLFGGAIASKLTDARGALAFMMAGAAGTALGTWTSVGFVFDMLGGYAAASSTACLTFKCLMGEWPTMDQLAGLVYSAFNPAAGVVGVLSACAMFALTTAGPDHWPNRLLTMLARSNTVCNEYFIATRDIRRKILGILEASTPWSVISACIRWLHTPTEDDCGLIAWGLEIWQYVCNFFVICFNVLKAGVQSMVNIPGCPFYSCQKGYKGPWIGSGMLQARCPCGAELIFSVENGFAKLYKGPRTCSNYWRGAVPVNARLCGSARPDPTDWTSLVVNYGVRDYCKYEKLGDHIFVTAVSSPNVCFTQVPPTLRAAVAVDGVQVQCYLGEPKTPWTTSACCYGPDGKGKTVKLPFRVDGHTPGVRMQLNLRDALETNDCNSINNTPSDEAAVSALVFKQELRRTNQLLEAISAGVDTTKLPAPSIEEVVVRKRQFRARTGSLTLPPPPRSVPGVSCPESLQRSDPLEGPSNLPSSPPVLQLAMPMPLLGAGECNPFTAIGCAMTETGGGPDDLPSYPPKKEVSEWSDGSWSTTTTASSYVTGPPYPKIRGKDSTQSAPAKRPTKKKLGKSEFSCSMSYTWTDVISFKTASKVLSATRAITSGFLKQRSLVYVTEPRDAELRKQKVTINRQPLFPPSYHKQVRLAKEKASKVVGVMWDYDEVAAHTPSKSAKSHITGLRGTDVRSGAARKAVLDLQKCVEAGEIPSHYRQTVIVPKEEVFVKTPQKPTKKPPRLISYPHLEMRCVEKMYYGQVAPDVVKAVMGDAYGFVDPRTRVKRLLSMWSPDAVGATCDTVCFDSTITPEDIMVETDIYSAAKLSDQHRAGIHTIARQLYAGGPMIAYDGREIGYRRCRSSGVYTTSSSNSLTCWLKVNAAAEQAGMKNPRFLICGDDCTVIWKSAGADADKQAMRVFASWMKVMGAPQDCVPQPKYSLEELTSCSSNVTSGITKSGKPYYFLTRDPRIPLGRCSAEGLGYNPSAAWIGYLIHHYPCLWVSRVLAVHFMEQMLFEDKLPETVTFDWYGKNYTVPVEDLPSIIAGVHGIEAFSVVRYTNAEILRVSQSLTDMTMPPLRAWRKKARAVLASAKRRGGAHAKLARFLLWHATSRPLPDLDKTSVARYTTFNYCDVYSPEGDVFVTPQRRLQKFLVKYLAVIVFALGLIAVGLAIS